MCLLVYRPKLFRGWYAVWARATVCNYYLLFGFGIYFMSAAIDLLALLLIFFSIIFMNVVGVMHVGWTIVLSARISVLCVQVWSRPHSHTCVACSVATD